MANTVFKAIREVSDLIPRHQFCREGGISESTFDRRSDIPKVRHGRRVYAPREALRPFLAKKERVE